MCNYKCIYPANWKQHIESEKHENNGKRKTRSDKVLEPKCKHCEYTTKNLTCMKVHCLTQHSTKEERKKEFIYYCEKCDLEHTQKYYLHDIMKLKNIPNKLFPFIIFE